MKTGPLVSVIVPAHDAETVIEAALRSIAIQDCAHLEVVVVDDGSTDRTGEIVRSSREPVGYLWQDNRGPSAARNAGLRATCGNLVAFLDADDLWPENSLRARVEFLLRHPECGIVQGRVRDLWPDPEDPDRHWLDPPRYGFNLGCALFRRSALLAVGGLDETLRSGEDVDLLIRTEALGVNRLRMDATTLFYRRRLCDDIGAYRRHIGNLARAVKGTLDERRRRGNPTGD